METVSYYKKMIIQVAKLMNTTNPNLEQDVDDLFNLEKSLAIVIALNKTKFILII